MKFLIELFWKKKIKKKGNANIILSLAEIAIQRKNPDVTNLLVLRNEILEIKKTTGIRSLKPKR